MLQQTNAQYQQANRELESKSFLMDVWYCFYLVIVVSRDEISRRLKVVQEHWAQLQRNKK